MGAISDIKNISKNAFKGEKIFIDTNIWIFLTFLSTESDDSKIRAYSDCMQKIKDVSAEIYTSPLCLNELAHVIERGLLDKYKENNGDNNFNLKQFRNIEKERKEVIDYIETCWQEIQQIYNPIMLPFNITQNYSSQVIAELKVSKIDAYDAIFLHTMRQNKIINILTDDKDFQDVKDIDIYTYL